VYRTSQSLSRPLFLSGSLLGFVSGFKTLSWSNFASFLAFSVSFLFDSSLQESRTSTLDYKRTWREFGIVLGGIEFSTQSVPSNGQRLGAGLLQLRLHRDFKHPSGLRLPCGAIMASAEISATIIVGRPPAVAASSPYCKITYRPLLVVSSVSCVSYSLTG
jgi:hypothetical protein